MLWSNVSWAQRTFSALAGLCSLELLEEFPSSFQNASHTQLSLQSDRALAAFSFVSSRQNVIFDADISAYVALCFVSGKLEMCYSVNCLCEFPG